MVCQNERCRRLQLFVDGTEDPVCQECGHPRLAAVQYFGGQDLRGFDLRGVKLSGSFFACDLRGMDLSQSDIEEAEFIGCLMGDVRISQARGFCYHGRVDTVHILGCDLHGADLPSKRHQLPRVFVANNVSGTALDSFHILLGRGHSGLGLEGCQKVNKTLPPDQIVKQLLHHLRPDMFFPALQVEYDLETYHDIRRLIETNLRALDI